MGEELVRRMTTGLNKMSWDGQPHRTPLGVQTYQMAVDIISEYAGDVKVFDQALKRIRAGDSRPYRLAGVAFMLTAASREKDGSYNQAGLEEAMSWLEKAQADEPDMADINFVESRIYLHSNQLENARLIQDYLLEQAPYSYHVLVSEALLWRAHNDLDRMETWFKKAIKYADNAPKKVVLHEQIGDAYFAAGNHDRALAAYKESLHFSRETGRLWHKLSQVFWEKGDIEGCKHSSDRAIEFGVGAPAQEMQQMIKRKLGTTGMLRRFLGSS